MFSDDPPLTLHADRLTASDAADLIERFGDAAICEAERRASAGRDAGNALSFCHWRQVSRLIQSLDAEPTAGTIH